MERQSSVAEAARLLATEAEEARAAASQRAHSFAEAAAEAQRGGNGTTPHGAAEATAQHHAAAERAEHLAAEAAEAERLAAAAEAALYGLGKSATAEAGAPAALGGTGRRLSQGRLPARSGVRSGCQRRQRCDLLLS